MADKRIEAVRSRTRRLRQRVSMHIYVLPNLLTTGNMFFGFVAIVLSIQQDFTHAAYAIVGAAVFDLLDGRVARITHSTSQFGAEYDSLCDLVSFGVAPGILLYLWALQPFGRIGWLASFLFACCGALRLARFNVQANVIEKNYFQGLPIPMAAGIVASSVLAFTELEIDASRSYYLLAMTILMAFVMVSNFRYRSFKDIDLKGRKPFWYLVIGVALVFVIATKPEVMLFVLFMGYALLGAIFGILKIGRHPISKPVVQSAEDDLHEVVNEDGEESEIDVSQPRFRIDEEND
jgi:CDP-diacylglycerol--serine O-phosphatidyltransferase